MCAQILLWTAADDMACLFDGNGKYFAEYLDYSGQSVVDADHRMGRYGVEWNGGPSVPTRLLAF